MDLLYCFFVLVSLLVSAANALTSTCSRMELTGDTLTAMCGQEFNSVSSVKVKDCALYDDGLLVVSCSVVETSKIEAKRS